MVVRTYVIPKGSDNPFISVYPINHPSKFAGKLVAANADGTDHIIISEIPADAVYCGDYRVTINQGRAESDPQRP